MAPNLFSLVALVAAGLPAKGKPELALRNPDGLVHAADSAIYLWKAGAIQRRRSVRGEGVIEEGIVGDVEAVWPRSARPPLAVLARVEEGEQWSYLRELPTEGGQGWLERRLQRPIVATAGNGEEVWVLDEKALSKLDANGGLVFITNRDRREWQVITGGVVCGSLAVQKAVPPDESRAAHCRLPEKWSFEGSWLRYKPFRCGSFIVEPVEVWLGGRQTQKGAPRKIRSFDRGIVVKDSAVAMWEMACLPDNQMVDLSTQNVFSLPDLQVVGRARCGEGRLKLVASVLPAKQPAACIDSTGKLAEVVVSSGKRSREAR